MDVQEKYLLVASLIPTTQAGALTWNQTGDLLVCGMAPSLWSHTSHGDNLYFPYIIIHTFSFLGTSSVPLLYNEFIHLFIHTSNFHCLRYASTGLCSNGQIPLSSLTKTEQQKLLAFPHIQLRSYQCKEVVFGVMN